MAKVFSNGKPGDRALGPSGPRSGALASRHDECWLGNFVEQLVGAQKLKGLTTPFKSTQPPAKKTRNQPQTVGHSPKMDLCPKSRRKNKKNGKNRKNGFSGKKKKNWLMGGRRWVVDRREAGDGVAVVGEEIGGGGLGYFGC
jgi:hypothetical protein